MSEKKPITEGHVRGIQKGVDKPTQPTNMRPIVPPPVPKPPPTPRVPPPRNNQE